jgi:putative ABC transport system permease protein
MNLGQSLKTAYRGLVTNKLRSFLTLLGIMIGVAAVVAMISIGTGASSYVSAQIRGLGSNLLIVTPGRAATGQGGASQAQGTGQNLTMADADAIKHEVSGISLMSPELAGQAQVIYQDKNVSTSVSGVTGTYEAVHNFHVLYGDFLGTEDQNVGAAVAVLGQNVVVNLFGEANPIGAVIKIKNVPFKVIGIMESKGGGFGNQDDTILIPLSTAQRRLFGADYLRSIYIQVTSENHVAQTNSEITSLLLSRHHVTDPTQKDFNVSSQADILNTVSQITGVLTILLGGIAAISLLVGGIGIMNIMLVSVTERTREIGLRKAVGAHGRDILFQFLMESVVLSLIGGIVGLGLGALGGIAIANYGGWTPVISLNSALLALGFSAGIGIFFGVYPARRASRLNPIEALRYE